MKKRNSQELSVYALRGADVDRDGQTLLSALPLQTQNSDMNLKERLSRLLEHINSQLGEDGLHRIAVAIYEPEGGRLKTYAAAGQGQQPLGLYEIEIAKVPSLSEVARTGKPRVIDEYQQHPSTQEHTRKIRQAGFRSALIMPLNLEHQFYGFVFFNSFAPGYFNRPLMEQFAPYADICRLLAVTSIRKTRVLRGAAQTAIMFGRARDDETGDHLQRMASYSRLIARNLADKYELSDEYIEMLYQFAPVHDVGKVAVPDSILLKPGRLDPDEFAQMREHVTRGVAMIISIAEQLDLEGDRRADMMRSIVAYHHERMDGSGYPAGMAGDQIPLEGRIVAVADVFDALTSKRVYKPMWSFQEAADLLRSEANAGKLCPDCVDAFLVAEQQINAIRETYGNL
ncbi:HD domain-containing protein [Halorhodospira halochloris]|uniref:HD domain-containing phosphohydrolase n=1 Tax=Halorhodospira halochloris TaxID=1052 RepID=UPI001EE86FED|nr:HD domain-containing phosphohydrolase [Halorhodospira halochloris]MCG5530328.1 HD domain-containing protein [Halorhodospira halochloris]